LPIKEVGERRRAWKTSRTSRRRKGSLTGYAAIKYTAIVIIVIAILVFLAVYVLPLVND
jgi:uncharacterized membrane protein YidH (DUF202 family)